MPNFVGLTNKLNDFNNRNSIDKELIITEVKTALNRIMISGDESKPFVLCVDSSEQGFSAVLGQVDARDLNQIVSFRYEKKKHIHERIYKKNKGRNKVENEKYLVLSCVLWALEEFKSELRFGNQPCRVHTKLTDLNSVNKIEAKSVIHKLVQIDNKNVEFVFYPNSWYFGILKSLTNLIDVYDF